MGQGASQTGLALAPCPLPLGVPMDFSLPPVGEGLIEVELVRWLVRAGDAVAPGQPLAEVMSDKATMEVPAPFAGTVTGLAAQPGTKVRVGQVVLTYTPTGG